MDFLRNLFSGRIGRKHYVFATLLIVIFYFVVYALAVLVFAGVEYFGQMLGISNDTSSNIQLVLITVLMLLDILATLVFTLKVSAKRFHDIGVSGYWSLALFVPLINIFAGATLLLRKGQESQNKYGQPTYSLPLFRAVFGKT